MNKTKTFFVALVLLCGVSATAIAQAELAIGIKAGPNFASIDTESSAGDNYKSRTGFHVGAFGLIKLTKIGIQPEILFSQQGSKFRLPNSSEDFEAKFSYFNIPVIFKLYTIAGINIQAGPQFGFITSAEADRYDDNTGNVTTQDIKDELKGSDISLALGLGWDLPFGLTLDGRYNLGLTDINDTSNAGAIKNQVWQISVGYKLIKLGK